MKRSRVCNICTWFLPGIALLMVLLLPLTAFAEIGGSAIPDIHSGTPLIVGNTYPTSLTLSNASNFEHRYNPVEVTEILFTPSCGRPDGDGRCDCPDDCDTGVFELIGPVEGTRGACAGYTFTATLVDADRGEYLFTPDSTLMLAETVNPNINTRQCEISFKLKVLEWPEKDSKPQICVQTSQLGYMSLIHPFGEEGEGAETNSVPFYCEPTISTTPDQSGPVNVGTVLHDKATVVSPQHGACNSTGMVTFKLFAPGDPECTGNLLHTEAVALVGGMAETIIGYYANTPGTYQWTAEYSGDSCNLPAASLCGEEPVVIICPTQTVTIPKPSTGTVGTLLQDCATVHSADGCNPTGAVTFKLFAPSDPDCTGTLVYTETVLLVRGEACTSTGYVANTTGTYHWTAVYTGDAYHMSSASLCAEEPVIITCPTQTVTIPNPSSGTVGTLIQDCATVQSAAGCNPTGTVTFKLFAPKDPDCTGTPVYEETVALVGGEACTTTGYPADTIGGTYHWTATYSGDAYHMSSASLCAEEPVIITCLTGDLGGYVLQSTLLWGIPLVADVYVYLTGQSTPERNTKSDLNGRFNFYELFEGSYQLHVTSEGYLPSGKKGPYEVPDDSIIIYLSQIPDLNNINSDPNWVILHTGINLFSSPCEVSDYDCSSFLRYIYDIYNYGDISFDGLYIRRLSPQNNKWQSCSMQTDQPFVLHPDEAYLIHIDIKDPTHYLNTLPFPIYCSNNKTVQGIYDLKGGFNLIGFPELPYGYDSTNLFKDPSLKNKIESVLYHNPQKGSFNAQYRMFGKPSGHPCTLTLKDGYIFYMREGINGWTPE